MNLQWRSRICVSIGEHSPKACLRMLHGQEFAEIRIDRLERPDERMVKAIFSAHPKLIATCRAGRIKDGVRKRLLLTAMDAGAAFVDVEVESPDAYKKEIIGIAKEKGCTAIVSFHDHEKTPSEGGLKRIVELCFASGAGIAKIACMVNSPRDGALLLGLLDDSRQMVVVGMGDLGRITRIAALLLGGAFTFASLGEGKQTAPGQLEKEELAGLLEMVEGRKKTVM